MTGKKLEGSKKPPLSCAECRRVKLKCNRVWPCLSCQKRGLAELCPEGSLATRPRYKPQQPIPQHFVQHIHQLQMRINELEGALSALQATVSTEPHPSLRRSFQHTYFEKKLMRKTMLEKSQALGDLLKIFPEASQETLGTKEPQTDGTEELIKSIGTLTITSNGKSQFFGPTAVSEGLAVRQEVKDPSDSILASLPAGIAALTQSGPFIPFSDAVEVLHNHIKSSFLPPLERTRALCASYFSYASFVANTVPEDEWFEDLFYRLYSVRRISDQPMQSHLSAETISEARKSVSADELSVFFNVLALGALTDLSTEPFSREADIYYELSRALVTRENALTEPSLAIVQKLFLGSYYEGLQSQNNSSRDCWIEMVAATKSAHTMGLHRDHSMFGLDERDVNRRRILFWETFSLDLIQSLALGRPPSTSIAYTDAKLPTDTFATINPKTGEVEESFHQWKYRFCAEVGSVVCDHVLRVKPPSYASALEADRAFQQFTTTFGRGLPQVGNWTNPATAAQYQMMIGTKETFWLYIHRGFFAHALSTHTAEPERSKYGRSVTAAYECAYRIVESMQIFVHHHPAFAARVWFLWNHVLSASFVLGSITVHAPGCSLAVPASAQLDIIHTIVERESKYHGRAEFMLPLINQLRVKGYNARLRYQAGSAMTVRFRDQSSSTGTGSTNSHSPVVATEGEDHDELAVIGGKARIVVSSSSRPSSSSPSQPFVQSQTADTSPSPEIYPVSDAFTAAQQRQQPPPPPPPQHQPMYHPVYPSPGQMQDTTDWTHTTTNVSSYAPPLLSSSQQFGCTELPPSFLESFSQHQHQGEEEQDVSRYGGNADVLWPEQQEDSALWQRMVYDLSRG